MNETDRHGMLSGRERLSTHSSHGTRLVQGEHRRLDGGHRPDDYERREGSRSPFRPVQPRFKVKPVAVELLNAIIAGQSDDRLKWEGDSKVRVLIGKVIPERSAVKDTLAGRRKRLRDELTRLLASAQWKLVRPNVYERGR
jgi:hypothetical protein